jgi:membrane-bound serine protease (ClpP class)
VTPRVKWSGKARAAEGASVRAARWVCPLSYLLPLVCLLGQQSTAKFDEESSARTGAQERLLVLHASGQITPATVAELREQAAKWAEYPNVVFRLDSPHGDLAAVRELADFIATGLKRRSTIAWIPERSQVLGPAVLLALAAHHIVVGAESELGASPQAVPTRSDELIRLAEGYASARAKYKGILVRALVAPTREDIVRVTMLSDRGPADRGGADRAGAAQKIEHYEQSEYERLRLENQIPGLHDRQVVLRKGEVLRLRPKQAREFGFTQHTDVSDIPALILALNLPVPLENVFDAAQGAAKPSNPAQSLIDLCNRPLARFFLILGGCLGLFLELKMLGTLIPGAAGLLCFVVLFATSFFAVTGSPEPSATWFEALLFVVGLGLIVMEVFLTPGMAIFALSGVVVCAASLVLAMVPSGELTGSGQMTARSAITLLVSGFGAGALAFLAALKVLPRTPFLGGGGLVNTSSIQGVSSAETAIEAQARALDFLGKTGVAETPLRPAGKVWLDSGEVVDVVAEGEFVERGEQVVITACSTTRISVARRSATGTPQVEG